MTCQSSSLCFYLKVLRSAIEYHFPCEDVLSHSPMGSDLYCDDSGNSLLLLAVLNRNKVAFWAMIKFGVNPCRPILSNGVSQKISVMDFLTVVNDSGEDCIKNFFNIQWYVQVCSDEPGTIAPSLPLTAGKTWLCNKVEDYLYSFNAMNYNETVQCLSMLKFLDPASLIEPELDKILTRSDGLEALCRLMVCRAAEEAGCMSKVSASKMVGAKAQSISCGNEAALRWLLILDPTLDPSCYNIEDTRSFQITMRNFLIKCKAKENNEVKLQVSEDYKSCIRMAETMLEKILPNFTKQTWLQDRSILLQKLAAEA
jgi:hypothetical protein